MIMRVSQERRVDMFSQNPYLFEKNIQMKQEELAREVSQERLIRECERGVKGMKPVPLKYRLLVVIGVLSAMVWFLH